MTSIVVTSGQTVSDLVLRLGDELEVQSGGTAIGTIVNGAAVVTVDRGGTTRGTHFVNGGIETVYGKVVDTVLDQGASERVEGSALAVGTTVNGRCSIEAEGTVLGAVINNGGVLYVARGTATDTAVYRGGRVEFLPGDGTTTRTVLRGGTENIENGGKAFDSTVASGGVLNVFPDGIASNTTVASGGVENVYRRGMASHTTVLNGGRLYVYEDGLDLDTIVQSGGVKRGGSAGLIGPSIGGLRAEQSTVFEAPIKPFAGLVLDDDPLGNPLETVSLTLANSDAYKMVNGTLSGIGLRNVSYSTYVLTGSPATVTRELNGLVFTPDAAAPGTRSTTRFFITVDSSTSFAYASGVTTVTDIGPGQIGRTPTGIGTGPDQLALSLSQNAFQGDALYTVLVDGHQVGGLQAASAAHGSGSDTLLINGSWGPGDHTFTINFLNDRYGGTAVTDRNLYLDGARYKGETVSGAQGALYGNGSLSLLFEHAPSTTPTSIGIGPDQLALSLSEHAFQGDAQYTVSVDGRQIDGPQTAHATHGSGSDTLLVNGNWAPGDHILTVDFLNDRYGGTAATDRNLYLDGAKYDGTTIPGAQANLYGNGSQNIVFSVAALSS